MASQAHSNRLISLTPELLEIVLSHLDARAVNRFGQTCKQAHAFIRADNQLLWKAAFLQWYDHPKHAWARLAPIARRANQQRECDWDWHVELRRRGDAARLAQEVDKLDDTLVQAVTATLLDILGTASRQGGEAASLNLQFLRGLPQDLDAMTHDFHRDIDTVGTIISDDRPVTRSMLGKIIGIPDDLSRFHIIYGPTFREEDSVCSRAGARARVYNWALNGDGAEYGPFANDGSGMVNWQTVEAIASLMYRVFSSSLTTYRVRPFGYAANFPGAVPSKSDVKEDWAGVEATWIGTYAFLDYRALVRYNLSHDREYPLDLGSYQEACGDLMTLELKIGDSECLAEDARLRTDLPWCGDLPPLFFEGVSTGENVIRPMIEVRGVCRLMPDGCGVRWRFIIRYADEDQWSLEGFQAGVRTGGIFGLWTHVDHDENGPMGPFFYGAAELCIGKVDSSSDARGLFDTAS